MTKNSRPATSSRDSDAVNPSSETPMQTFLAWAPHAAVITGLIVTWISPGEIGMTVMYGGFMTYGLLGIWTSIKRRYYLEFSMKLFKLLTQVLIFILAVMPFLSGEMTFVWILILIVMDNLLFTTARIESNQGR
jgi:hypothetical protein